MSYSFPFDKTKWQPLGKQLSTQEDVPAVLSILQYCLQRRSLAEPALQPSGQADTRALPHTAQGWTPNPLPQADTQGEKEKTNYSMTSSTMKR